MSEYIFTSESVTEGHPDKICDAISDAVLDAYLLHDPSARVACEAAVKNNTIVLLGEISSKASINIESVVRNVIKNIGYDKDEYGFNAHTAEIINLIAEQSPDIAQGVNNALETRHVQRKPQTGAGDQGIIFGYAANETHELMPLPIVLAHNLAKKLTCIRKKGRLKYLRPDGKTEVSVKYSNGKPVAITAIIISAQHDETVQPERIRKDITELVIKKVIPDDLLNDEVKILINPTGRFVTGGPAGDSGLTGRKTIVDTYGGVCGHGGGAFSGKDPTKVDRSAAYAARYAAKNIVAAGLAERCEIQLAYAIGVAKPVSIYINTYGTGIYPDEEIVEAVNHLFDFSPDAIISTLGLTKPIFHKLSAYGHVGREDLFVSWERTDKVKALKKYFEKNEENVMKKYSHIESALLHGGFDSDPLTGAVNVPIYQTSTYEQLELGKHKGWEYSRTGNPTRAVLEKLIAELEHGKAGFAFASGMAAITAILSLFKSGDKIIISSNVYGGTFRLLDKVFNNFNITYSIEDTTDLTELAARITPDVKAIYIESPANPLMTITDIKAVSELAHAHGLLSIVDNTFMTPYIQRPLDFGADIVIHSATKYLGGHSDLVAGLAVVNDDGLAERLAFIQNSTGGVLQPFDSFLLIRGIKTLGVRMDRHVKNALHIAKFLSENKAVKRVYYPGLESDSGYAINRMQAKNGGAMISFELYENHDISVFFKSLKLVALAESLGGVESLICHPSSMTHASIPYEIRQKVGITEGLIRISPGLEHHEDIINDLDNAIKESKIK